MRKERGVKSRAGVRECRGEQGSDTQTKILQGQFDWGYDVEDLIEKTKLVSVRKLREKLAGRKLQLDGIIVVARDWGSSETSSPFFQQKQTRLHRMRKIGFVYAFRTLEVQYRFEIDSSQ